MCKAASFIASTLPEQLFERKKIKTRVFATRVADPDPGSGAFLPLDPGWVFSGSRISDPESRIPNPYF
jgi:hypothetical protein